MIDLAALKQKYTHYHELNEGDQRLRRVTLDSALGGNLIAEMLAVIEEAERLRAELDQPVTIASHPADLLTKASLRRAAAVVEMAIFVERAECDSQVWELAVALWQMREERNRLRQAVARLHGIVQDQHRLAVTMAEKGGAATASYWGGAQLVLAQLAEQLEAIKRPAPAPAPGTTGRAGE